MWDKLIFFRSTTVTKVVPAPENVIDQVDHVDGSNTTVAIQIGIFGFVAHLFQVRWITRSGAG
jgi:hypothetical protein